MPKVASLAPSISGDAVVDGQIVRLSWEQIHQGQWLVVLFYPLDFTFVCPTEIVAFSDAAERFESLGTGVVAVSVDSAYTHLAWTNTTRKKGGLGKVVIPLIADLDKRIARAYDVLLPDGVALRGLFLIDPKCVIRHATINDLAVGRSVDETIRVIEAFQFCEEHGEVCPANWQPGEATMVPDPQRAQEYFERVEAVCV